MSLHIIILIPSQSVFALTPYCCVLSGEATRSHTNFIVFGLTRPGLEPTFYDIYGLLVEDQFSPTCMPRANAVDKTILITVL